MVLSRVWIIGTRRVGRDPRGQPKVCVTVAGPDIAEDLVRALVLLRTSDDKGVRNVFQPRFDEATGRGDLQEKTRET